MHLLNRFCWTLFLSFLLLCAPHAQGQQAAGGGAVQVHLNYTGSGTVDDSHKIYVALWDTPSFVGGGASGIAPLELKPVSSKNGSAVFTGVTTSTVYVSCVYDPSGQWDAQSGPPPAGSSLGLYSKEPGKPAPIKVESGKTATVTLTFDDSIKMPSMPSQ